MSLKERRETHRVPIKVLVKCAGVDMWAEDIAHDGVRLRWSRRLAYRLCPECNHSPYDRLCESLSCLCAQRPIEIRKGQQVNLDGLIYTEKGSEPIGGRVQWVRLLKAGGYHVGVRVTSPYHRRHFKALEH